MPSYNSVRTDDDSHGQDMKVVIMDAKTRRYRNVGLVATLILMLIVVIGMISADYDFSDTSAAAESNPLQKYYVSNEEAMCNDGSPSIYYMRRTNTTKWLIYVEGGVLYCWDKETCDTRQATMPELMTSTMAEETKEPTGLMSDDCDLNPDWCDANIGYIFYCSSDYFSGTVTEEDSEAGVHFLGWTILQSAIDDLLAAGMADATQILYSGKGGGAVAVLFTVDRIVAQIEDGLNGQECDIRSLSDTGWISAHDPFNEPNCESGDALTCNIAGGVQRGVDAWQPEYPTACGEAGYTWECFFGNWSFQYIETNSFIFIYEYDYAQLDTDGLVEFHWDMSNEDGIVYAEEMAEALVNQEILPNANAKYFFMPGCWDHEIMDKDVLQDIYVDDMNIVDAMREWYDGADSVVLYDPEFVFNSNPSCVYYGGI